MNSEIFIEKNLMVNDWLRWILILKINHYRICWNVILCLQILWNQSVDDRNRDEYIKMLKSMTWGKSSKGCYKIVQIIWCHMESVRAFIEFPAEVF